MAEPQKVMLTREGKKRMEEELLELKTVRRPEVVQKIKEARAQGDLSENAEYDAAKDEQGHIEGRIEELESILRVAEVVDEESIDPSIVNIGSKVKVYDEMFSEEITYTIVSEQEADPMKDYIASDSPVGKALMGARAGQEVSFETPGGTCTLKVLEVSR